MNYIYTWQEENFETAQLHLSIFEETPVDGVTWHSGYSHPCLVINLSAQIQHFEVEVDSNLRYSGPVVPGDFSFLPPHSGFKGFYQGDYFSYACITFLPAMLSSAFSDSRPLVMESDPFLKACVQTLYVQGFRDGPDALIYREILSEAIISHLRLVHLKAGSTSINAPNLDRLESYVRENLGQKLTVSELARRLGLTPKALQRAW